MLILKRTAGIALCLAFVAVACRERYAETNDDRAYFSHDGQCYRVDMKGRRLPLVHDPLSLLLMRTYEETITMQLPRLDGVIEGREIPVSPDKLGYVGRIVINKRTMNVELYYDDTSDGPRRPLPWNDEYTLVERQSR